MTDVVISPITSGYNTSRINTNFTEIQDVINDEVVHSIGGNNVMQQDLDMNSKDLLNVRNVNADAMLLNGEAVTISNLGSLGPNTVGTANIVDFSITDSKIAGPISPEKVSYIQGATGSVLRDIQSKLRDYVSVLDFIPVSEHENIAANTSTLDVTQYFQLAIDASNDVYVPPGTYIIKDQINMPKNKRLYGAPRRSILSVPADFNLSADGVIKFTSGEPGPVLEGIYITFYQPDSANLVDYVQYPPAIYAVDISRFRIEHVRLQRPYVGINMTGNSGGSVINDLESSAITLDISIDGAQDSIKLSAIHIWPFNLTSTQQGVYSQGYGIKVGRCDDFHLVNSLIFNKVNAAVFSDYGNGKVFGHITNVGFDARGGLRVFAGSLQVSDSYFSIAYNDTRCIQLDASISAATLLVSNCTFYIPTLNTSISGYVTVANGGSMNITNCKFETLSLDKSSIYVSGSTSELNVSNCYFGRDGNNTYTQETISVVSGYGLVCNCLLSSVGTGSGDFVKIQNDIGYIVKDNVLRGWNISVPTGSIANTIVDGNVGGAAGANKESYTGYFSSDATTTVRIPTGWTVTKQATGRYYVNHTLALDSIFSLDYVVTAGTPDITVAIDVTNTEVSRTRIICNNAAGTATDSNIFFNFKRRRT